MGRKRSAQRRGRRKTNKVRRLPAKVEADQSDPPPPSAIRRAEWLPEGWQMEVKMRKDGIKADRYYICPISGKMFRSKPEVMRYLGLSSGMVEESYCHPFRLPDGEEQMASHGSEYSKILFAALEDNPLEWLPTGWILEIGTCTGGSANNYKCYFNPHTGLRFYSREEVLQYLEAHKLSGSTLNMGVSACAKALDSCSSTQKEKTHMECHHNVLAEIDCFPSGLPRGWIKELRITRTRSSRQTRRDSYYIDMASGYGFPSKRDVFLYLANEEACRSAFRLDKSHLPKHPIAAIGKNAKKTAPRHIFSRQISNCNAEISDHPEKPSSQPVDNAEKACHVEVAPEHSHPVLEDKNTLVRDVPPEWQFKLEKKQRQSRKPRRDCWLGSSNFKDIKLDVNECSLMKRKAANSITIPLRASKHLAGDIAKARQSVGPEPTLTNDSDPNSGPDLKCESDLKHKAILDGKKPEVEKCIKEQQIDPYTKARQVNKHQPTPAEGSDPSRGSCDEGARESDHQVILDRKKHQVEEATKEQQVDPQMELPCGSSWKDPCLEFAFKTLTGDLPASIQDYFPRHQVSMQSSVPNVRPAKLSSDKTLINDDARP